MSTYYVRLLERMLILPETMTVHLQRPPTFTFRPGQFITVRLPGDPASIPGRGTYDFSLASAPSDDDLLLVMRMRESVFKRHLSSLPLGVEVQIQGPYGEMVIPDNQTDPLVFLAGGMGIAPFRSMIREYVYEKRRYPITLIYANQTREASAFYDEFEYISQISSSISYVPLMTKPEMMTSWQGASGYITSDLLSQHIAHPLSARYYIVGPVRMVMAAKRQVRAIGVPEEHIFMEIFTGY